MQSTQLGMTFLEFFDSFVDVGNIFWRSCHGDGVYS